MKRPATALVVATVAASAGGCGTVCNFMSGEPSAYGGLKKDAEWADQFASKLSSGQPITTDTRAGLVLVAVAWMELPLTFAADTLTLPITLWLESRRAANNERAGGS
jgi:uncharacterized protein YceK